MDFVPSGPREAPRQPAALPGQAAAPSTTLEESLQARFDAAAGTAGAGGLPPALRRGIHALSGMDLADVRVHRNSAQPAQLNALAYAQGSQIHLAPGQERHLPHEAWHVVQQRQGRVRPTVQHAGVAVNDDAGLEREADRMGERAQRSAPAVQLSALHDAQLGTMPQQLAAAQCTGRFLADDGQPPGPGQVGKGDFLQAMRTKVMQVSRDVLGPYGMAQDDCPDLAYWVDHYGSKPAAYVEQVVERYAPGAQDAGTWQAFLDALVARIRQGLVAHTKTGEVVDPEPIPDSIDRQRPPLSVFGIQKKDAPVAQLGCGSSASVREPQQQALPGIPAISAPRAAPALPHAALAAGYDFTTSTVTALNDKVFRVVLAAPDPHAGTNVIVKNGAAMDAYTNSLATALHIGGPQMRRLTAQEQIDLAARPVGGAAHVEAGAYVMGEVQGRDLYDHFAHAGKQDAPQELLLQLGETIGFQMLIDGWDRWPLRGAGGRANAQSNMGNIMLSGAGDVVLIDSDTQAVRPLATVKDQFGPLIQQALNSADGGVLIDDAAKLLAGFFNDSPATRPTLRAGFIRFLRTLKATDISAIQDPTHNVARDQFVAGMRTYLVEHLDEMED